MSIKGDGNQNPQSTKVLKLGLNISVSGDPGTDFEIVLDENGQKTIQPLVKNESQSQSSDPSEQEKSSSKVSKQELEETNIQTITPAHSTGAIAKHRKKSRNMNPSESPTVSETEKSESKDSSIIDRIKSTMEHFEKFSDHIREIPRLRNRPLATSTPFADKHNSKSESNLVQVDYRPRKFAHLYDFQSRKEYFKSSIKPLPPDLFLKPLPGENLYKRGMYTRYFDLDPYRHYGSDNSLNKTQDNRIICAKSKSDDKYEMYNLPSDQPVGILKKFDSESGDKQSTSSAESVKDIKIYQSGGILIMQNFKDNFEASEKKELSDFSAKLIENCNKLREEISSFQTENPFDNSSDENKNLGKTVQFDMTSIDGQKSKSDSSCTAVKDESSFARLESSGSTSDCPKTKDTSPQGTSQSQDFPSLSTQENDSIISNQRGTSPSFVSPKKLEWDSGADIGYIDLDVTKENLSTIERIVLKGLSSDGQSEKNVISKKKPERSQNNRSKLLLERIPADPMIKTVAEEVANQKRESGEFLLEGITGKKSMKVAVEGTKRENGSKAVSIGGSHEVEDSTIESSSKGIPSAKTDKASLRERELIKRKKTSEKTDKSVNVNTLFGDRETSPRQSTGTDRQIEHQAKVRGRKFSPRVKKFKKKRPSTQRTAPLKDKADSSMGKSWKSAPHTSPLEGESFSKNNFKNGETIPNLNDAELSKEVEEITIDQRYKSRQNAGDEDKSLKEPAASEILVVGDKPESKPEGKVKSRPISASSGSNKTVLQKALEEKSSAVPENKFTHQIVQTTDVDCESVGIQAFASQKSSDCEMKSQRTRGRENVNTSSKNIQAFGLNASLPKQLEHPKESSESITNQNTKSTQYFGGVVNSLPNYHANLLMGRESFGREPQVLKARKNLETEIIRLKEENEKNILANEAGKPGEAKSDQRRRSSNENKENLMSKTSTNSKRSQSNASRKTSKENNMASQKSEKREREHRDGNEKNMLEPVEGSECVPTSEDVSSLILTSEVLKEHGDSIDRNIIQEKYFQSQLVEFELRKMISRSTSMEGERKQEEDTAGKKYATTGCQYSPQSKEGISGERGKYRDNDSSKGKHKSQGGGTSEQYDSSQNMAEDCFETLKSTNQERGLGAGDSLPSSTQTAHSWIAGKQNSGGNVSGVDRARSFEYLPGHIYESSGNLREELPSETEQNLITSSSSDSDTAKRSLSERAGESEGRRTLVLENSTESSCDTDRLKILDGNLARLDFAVLKLREKDAQVQSITRSLLANLWKKNGFGDCLTLGEVDVARPEGANGDGKLSWSGKERGDPESEMSGERGRTTSKEKETSIACQTEEKSSSSDAGRFYEERKALEKRISEEKKSQIKWIENEINHLNVLRGLLEKQSCQRRTKRKHSAGSLTSDDASKSEGKYSEKISSEVHPRPATPVYGCTVSVTENPLPEIQHPHPHPRERETEREREQGSSQCCHYFTEESHQYGMAVSLSSKDNSKNWRRVVMLPVGVQVSLKNNNFSNDCVGEEADGEMVLQSSHQRHHSKSYASENATSQHNPCRHAAVSQSDANTQYPSGRKTSGNLPSASIQTSLSPDGRCAHCNEESCVCINLEKSYSSLSRSSRSRTSERRGSSKLTSLSEEPEFEDENGNRNKIRDSTENSKKFPDNGSDSSGNRCKLKPVHEPAGKWQETPDLADNRDKRNSVQNSDCRCQNCLIQVAPSIGKPDFSCRCPCQSNIYLNIDKSSTDLGTCHCSKSHTQNPPSNSSCHVIKIHGGKCCPPGRGCSCCCKRRTVAKRTENQSCQTDVVKIVSEDSSPVAEDADGDVRESYGRRQRTPDGNVPQRVPCPSCGGGKKGEKKERTADADHPRHYFLRIEEREVDDDDSKESVEEKKSLEVITVTVPVKKAGKGKIYGSKIQETRESYQDNGKFLEPPPVGCSCCAECLAHRSKPRQEYETNNSGGTYQRSVAEKPESPRRDCEPFLRQSQYDSYETANTYGGVSHPSNELNREFSSREYYQEFPRGESYSSERRVDYNSPRGNSAAENLQEIQSEYDSHKKSRNGNGREHCDDSGPRFGGSRRNPEKPQRRSEGGGNPGRRTGERNSRQQEFAREANGRNHEDYYNYNKREFMTKSELLKEEEQKRKVRQPSLQDYLSSNRPDFYDSAERRRQIISERARERVRKHSNRMECLMSLIHRCNEHEQASKGGPRRIFTTVQMREQTMKRYKRLPEVTGRIADQKKKDEYRTNKLMADIFAKKLQSEALKGHINLSNSIALLHTI